MARGPAFAVLALCIALLLPPARAVAASEEVNPCRSAAVSVVGDDKYLDVIYRVALDNPTCRPADVTLLSRTAVLDKVEGVSGDLVVNRVGGALVAGVPAGWHGELVIRTKVPIAAGGSPGWRQATLAMPPAVSRSMTFDLPGPNVQLALAGRDVAAAPIVTDLGPQGERARFSVVPLAGDLFIASWAPVAAPHPAGYTLSEFHRITEDVPAYGDDVTLTFAFPGTPPAAVRAEVPDGAAISSVKVSGGATWKIADGMLQVTLPERPIESSLTVQCRLEGAAPSGAQAFAVPLFGSRQAERWQGAVYVNGGRHQLAFSTLDGARQTAAEGWRLACEFQGKDVRIVVSAVPMPVRRQATVETHYAVSEYRVTGTHNVALATEGAPVAAMTLLLPAGHTARSVTGDVRDWSQEGGSVHIKLAPKPDAPAQVQVITESLTGGRLRLELAPPTVEGATSCDYAMAVTHGPEVLLQTAEAEAPWRVTPQALPAWLAQLAPPIAYRYRDAAPAVAFEALPVEAELRGTVQDHVALSADRIQRDTLFLIDIQKRAVQSVEVLLPAGLTPESVEGPYVEGWDVTPGAAGAGPRVTVRFPAPLTGGIHFRLVGSRPAGPGTLSLRGIGLAGAPALHGWLGIGTDVSTRVRPVEDGQTNLASVLTSQAPAYLKGFNDRLVYEFYSTDWQLGLTAEHVPAVYDAETLNVLSFSASGVEATAFVNVKVAEGGLGEVELHVPAGAVSPQVDAPDAVVTRWSDGVGLVRFRGPRTGTTTLRVNYLLPAGAATATVEAEPVRVGGARAQSGVLLLVQAGPEVDVKPQQPPRALQPTEALEQYADWSYRREHPALAAYGYRDAGWSLPVAVTTHPLSSQMLAAIIPLAKLDTLVQDGGETLNRLRLFVTNTNQQFLTVDLARLDPKARLIGTYVWGRAVKPFRQGTVIELPLFASEMAAQVGMSAIDIIYAAPTGGLSTMGRQRFGLPDMGLNVGKVEWTVNLPPDYRLTAVGGNLDKPVSAPPPVRGLAARLMGPAADFVREHVKGMLMLAVAIAGLAAFAVAVWYLARLAKRSPWTLAGEVLAVIAILAILAGLLMPSLGRARESARIASESSNLHNIGVALSMYREEHGHAYPVSLDVLADEGAVRDREMFTSPNGEDIKLVYVRPGPNPPATAVVAYFYHPASKGANVLFADGAVQWVEADANGNLMNPRAAGPPIASASSLASAPAKPEAVFGSQAVSTKELAEALTLGQQMAKSAGAQVANRPVDRASLNNALIAANQDKLRDAKDAYAKEHGGQQPASLEDLSGYVADDRLRQAMREEAAHQPQLESGAGRAPAAQTQQQAAQTTEQVQKAEQDQLSRSRYSLGNAFMQQGRYDEAEQQFSDAVKLDAGNSEARRGLEQLRALRSEVKAQPAAPQSAAPAPAKAADKLEAIARQLQQQELSYSAAQSQPAQTMGGYGGRFFVQAHLEPNAAPVAAIAQEELPVLEPRLAKASLVQQVSGGRSIGALPIAIDFPTPPSVSYSFVKPFLGRAEATLSFRVLRSGSILLLELLLAAAALASYGLARRRAPRAAAGYAAVVLAICIAALSAAPAAYASAFGAAALVMGACLAAEIIRLTILNVRAIRAGS